MGSFSLKHLFFFFGVLAISAAGPTFAAENRITELGNSPDIRPFTAADGTQLSYSVIGAEEGAAARPVVIVQGKGETVYRYVEFAQEMRERGYGPIYLMDHRGQGFSERGIKNKPAAIHVKSFDSYVNDLVAFLDGPVAQDLAQRGISEKPFMIAHSMGGPIAELALRKKPNLVDRVAYITPMFQVNMGPRLARWKNKPARILSQLLCFAGCSLKTVGRKPGEARGKMVSHDLKRLEAADNLEIEKGIQTPQASLSWVKESLKGSEKVHGKGPKAETSSVIFQAEGELLVSNPALYEYACRADNCTLAELPGGHSLHQETDDIRHALLDKIDEFFRAGSLADDGSCGGRFKLLKAASRPRVP